MSALDPWLARASHLLPQHALSRVVHRLARIESPRVQPLLRWFVRQYGLNMDEAAEPDIAAYPSFNALFTRALREDARPLAGDDNTVVSPADSRVSAAGRIEAGQIFQAKGHHYTVRELLGGEEDLAEPFRHGHFVTLYLSPRHYHRLHMPLTGTLTHMLHVPGRLFSVAPRIVRHVPRLYARNERVVTCFDTHFGPMAVALIGAQNVGSIETVWAGEVTPPAGQPYSCSEYPDREITLERGAEMGRFNLGSSVVLLLPDHPLELGAHLTPETEVQVRGALGRFY
ncbi:MULTISPECIES: archaetidylserine decarboxylase [unclassified Thioalkalivibrio]|uniref:archaetidylserine decarboxylase n=1 Tax=unclassified Thioalkalivibrio TaxID=2621013 RepID=UPI00035FEF5C|nr:MULTISPECIES: archaetidylserine decarboxylase [unclassified Thioalkalivibrio]